MATLKNLIFGGADGTYAIKVASQIAVTNISFNNSGYTLSGSSIYNTDEPFAVTQINQ